MGLSFNSTGRGLRRRSDPSARDADRRITLAGNPNVGKSTLFNALTGLRQHTGNWTGKTVEGAVGYCHTDGKRLEITDLPGTYSLSSRSPEEAIARDGIAFGAADTVCVVCDATCPQRGLTLALQIMEMTPSVVVCLNLMDEAEKRGMRIDTEKLSTLLSVPVIGTSSKRKASLRALAQLLAGQPGGQPPADTLYPPPLEDEIGRLAEQVSRFNTSPLPHRFIAMQLLAGDTAFLSSLQQHTGIDPGQADVENALRALALAGWDRQRVQKRLLFEKIERADRLCRQTVHTKGAATGENRADRILTGRLTSLPVMLLMLLGVFWITIYGAQIPSDWLYRGLFALQQPMIDGLQAISCPPVLVELLVFGLYRVLAWVVSVMLPPMAIFFPLFTLLEDLGVLPRIAFNLDKGFQKCHSCGKQALTMCMGFGCNAAGVIGCRIITSRRERLIAMLTNSLVPCNGRFPTLIALLSLFFVASAGSVWDSLTCAALLTLTILLGVAMTFVWSFLLSKTVLRGAPSFYSLELPPYRMPRVGQVLVRSILDRTVFVLARSAAVAAPAGVVIWLLANTGAGDGSLLDDMARFLEPAGRLMGLDGVILLAFILGMPANEIVIPVMLMTYTGGGLLTGYDTLADLKAILLQNGWTWQTALCVILFMLFHWPCSTTVLTVYKETKSLPYTALSVVLPTLTGVALCVGAHFLLG